MQEAILPVAAQRKRSQAIGSGDSANLIGQVIADPADLRRRLTAWYARAKRDLPWRRSRDPYRVWVSEIMLQQTQVERVKEFFVRFVERFPSVENLAAANEQAVLKHWEGLGYYRRARQLHAASKAIVADHGGEFPRTVAGLMELPGIGRYTAGAIASIAMDVQAPIVEANSRRVIARLAGHDAPVGGAGEAALLDHLGERAEGEQERQDRQAAADHGDEVLADAVAAELRGQHAVQHEAEQREQDDQREHGYPLRSL